MPMEPQEQFNRAQAVFQSEYPVPVIAMAKHMGIDVFETPDLDDSVSGMITKNNDTFTIYVNTYHAPVRKRFTIAHEVGHYVKHQDAFKNGTSLTDYKNSLMRMDHGYDPIERMREAEANAFAADLLMPSEEFIQQWQKGLNTSEIANYFFVSEQSAHFRAVNLGFISGW